VSGAMLLPPSMSRMTPPRSPLMPPKASKIVVSLEHLGEQELHCLLSLRLGTFITGHHV
jgi:hypothetical protein